MLLFNLHSAAKNEDVKALKQLIASGKRLNKLDKRARQPLTHAITNLQNDFLSDLDITKRIATIEELLAWGAALDDPRHELDQIAGVLKGPRTQQQLIAYIKKLVAEEKQEDNHSKLSYLFAFVKTLKQSATHVDTTHFLAIEKLLSDYFSHYALPPGCSTEVVISTKSVTTEQLAAIINRIRKAKAYLEAQLDLEIGEENSPDSCWHVLKFSSTLLAPACMLVGGANLVVKLAKEEYDPTLYCYGGITLLGALFLACYFLAKKVLATPPLYHQSLKEIAAQAKQFLPTDNLLPEQLVKLTNSRTKTLTLLESLKIQLLERYSQLWEQEEQEKDAYFEAIFHHLNKPPFRLSESPNRFCPTVNPTAEAQPIQPPAVTAKCIQFT